MRISAFIFIFAIVGYAGATRYTHDGRLSPLSYWPNYLGLKPSGTDTWESSYLTTSTTQSPPIDITTELSTPVSVPPIRLNSFTTMESERSPTTTTDISTNKPETNGKNDPTSKFENNENKFEKPNYNQRCQSPMNEKGPSYSHGGNSNSNYVYPNSPLSANFFVNPLYSPIREPQLPYLNSYYAIDYNLGNIWNPYQSPYQKPFAFWPQYFYTPYLGNQRMPNNGQQYALNTVPYPYNNMADKPNYNSEPIYNKNCLPLAGPPDYPNRNSNMQLNHYPMQGYAGNTPLVQVTYVNPPSPVPEAMQWKMRPTVPNVNTERRNDCEPN